MMLKIDDPTYASILAKVEAYCDFYRKHRSTGDFPAGIEDGIREAANAGKTSFLKAVSKELDLKVREVLTERDQEIVIQLMIDKGVLAGDLPKTITLQKLKRLLKKGSIRTEEEHFLARQFIQQDRIQMLSEAEAELLGALLDNFEVKTP